ncbi:MAG: PEP-CTERM sorting domain-containing protein [Alphaproteobacteria bacterium]
MFAALAPTDARATTPISIFDGFGPFPESVTGDATLPNRGVVVSVDANDTSDIAATPFDNNLQEVGNGLSSPSFGLVIAAQQLGFEIFPFSNQGNGVPFGGPDTPGNPNVPDGAGPPDSGGDGSVNPAPEPATWIMMIAGFWIVAWRLRHRGRDEHGPVPAHA